MTTPPIEDTRPLRSVEAIRADLEHPHTAALTALHSTTIGDGPIGRLLRDVAPLLADRDEAIEAESQAGDRIAAERDAAVADNARLLARIAAVEAPQNVERLCEVMHDAYERAAIGAGWETQQASRKPWADVPEANKTTMRAAVSALLAALASPTPTGPETHECGNCGEPFPGEHIIENEYGNCVVICPRHTALGSTTAVHDGFIGACDLCVVYPGPATPTEPTEPAKESVPDLMAALRASVEAAKARRFATATPEPTKETP